MRTSGEGHAFHRSPHPPTGLTWDQLSRAYALVRREAPAEMIQEEMEALRAMLEERQGRNPRNLHRENPAHGDVWWPTGVNDP